MRLARPPPPALGQPLQHNYNHLEQATVATKFDAAPGANHDDAKDSALSRVAAGLKFKKNTWRAYFFSALHQMFPFYHLLWMTILGVALGSSLSPYAFDRVITMGTFVIESSVASVFITLPLMVDICLDISFGRSLYLFGDSKNNFRVSEKMSIFVGCMVPPVYYLVVAGSKPGAAARQIQCALFSCAMFSILRRKLRFLHQAGVITIWEGISHRADGSTYFVYVGTSVLLMLGRIIFAVGAMNHVMNVIALILLGAGVACYFALFASTILRDAPTDLRKSALAYNRVHAEYLAIAVLYAFFLASEFAITLRCTAEHFDGRAGVILGNAASCLLCLGVFIFSVRTMKFDVINEKVRTSVYISHF
jgi:hypothetical protein